MALDCYSLPQNARTNLQTIFRYTGTDFSSPAANTTLISLPIFPKSTQSHVLVMWFATVVCDVSNGTVEIGTSLQRTDRAGNVQATLIEGDIASFNFATTTGGDANYRVPGSLIFA